MESMRSAADVSSPEHSNFGNQGGCNVHLSWHQGWANERAGRGSLMTVRFCLLTITPCILAQSELCRYRDPLSGLAADGHVQV